MSYVLIITNELNGQTEIVNRLFSSVQEAQQYVNENHLILQKIITETEYQNLMMQYQQQRLQQRYQRPYPGQPQNQQEPQRVLLQETEEPEEPEEQYQRRAIQPVQIVKPRFAPNMKFYPVFVGRKMRGK